jgi:hypothetical protein
MQCQPFGYKLADNQCEIRNAQYYNTKSEGVAIGREYGYRVQVYRQLLGYGRTSEHTSQYANKRDADLNGR